MQWPTINIMISHSFCGPEVWGRGDQKGDSHSGQDIAVKIHWQIMWSPEEQPGLAVHFRMVHWHRKSPALLLSQAFPHVDFITGLLQNLWTSCSFSPERSWRARDSYRRFTASTKDSSSQTREMNIRQQHHGGRFYRWMKVLSEYLSAEDCSTSSEQMLHGSKRERSTVDTGKCGGFY